MKRVPLFPSPLSPALGNSSRSSTILPESSPGGPTPLSAGGRAPDGSPRGLSQASVRPVPGGRSPALASRGGGTAREGPPGPQQVPPRTRPVRPPGAVAELRPCPARRAATPAAGVPASPALSPSLPVPPPAGAEPGRCAEPVTHRGEHLGPLGRPQPPGPPPAACPEPPRRPRDASRGPRPGGRPTSEPGRGGPGDGGDTADKAGSPPRPGPSRRSGGTSPGRPRPLQPGASSAGRPRAAPRSPR